MLYFNDLVVTHIPCTGRSLHCISIHFYCGKQYCIPQMCKMGTGVPDLTNILSAVHLDNVQLVNSRM